jgi:hypothetical protein
LCNTGGGPPAARSGAARCRGQSVSTISYGLDHARPARRIWLSRAATTYSRSSTCGPSPTRRDRFAWSKRATGNEFTTSTANVFVERDYYTVSSIYAEDDHRLIEGLYAQVEGVAAPIFEQLVDGDFPLGGQERSQFASFMSLQVTRGRQHREMLQNITDVLGRQMLRMAANQPTEY